MKKLLIRLSFFIPLLIFLIILEQASKTNKIFNIAEDTIAKTWLNRKNIAFSFDYDDRVAHKYYIESSKDKKDIVVFGSSRSAKIDGDFFKQKTFFNNSVTGANLEDYIGMYQIYDYDKKPKIIILGLDPWILDSQHDTTKRWLDLTKEFYQLTKTFPISSDTGIVLWYYGEKLKNYFFIPHFQYSIKKIARNLSINNKNQYYPTADFEGELPIVHYDGSISESLKIRSKKSTDTESEIRDLTEKCPTTLNANLDKEKEFLFTNFLQTLKNDSVEIIFWLAPFHPLTYDTIKNDLECNLAVKSESYFRDIAKKNNIQILGSYDPNKYGLSGNLFYDSIHPKQGAIQIILKKDGLVKD